VNAAAEDALGYLPEIRAFLAARCRDEDLANDLSQEVAARVLAGGSSLDRSGNLRAYLFSVARNVWRDWLRRELVRRRAAPRLALEGQDRAVPAADSELLARELGEAAGRAIAALPRQMREVVELRHREQLTFREIAVKLNRPLGTVLGQMRDAMLKVRQALEAYR